MRARRQRRHDPGNAVVLGGRGQHDEGLATFGAVGRAHEIGLAAGAGNWRPAQGFGTALARQVDLHRRVDRNEVVVLPGQPGIVGDVRGVQFHRRVAVHEVVDFARTQREGRENLAAVDVRSQSGAQDAIRVIDQAINDITNQRGYLGAIQSQTLQSGADNLQTALTNTTAADLAAYLHQGGYELTVVEEAVLDKDGKKTGKVNKNFAVKYAPAESEFSEDQIEKYGIRVVFYNVDAEFNRDLPRINPRANEPGVFHKRIAVNAGGDGRNVLWLDMDQDQISEAGFQGKEFVVKDGKWNGKAFWNLFWSAKYVPRTKETFLTGIGSATVQAGISYDVFQHFSNAGATFNIASAAVTWIYVAVLTTYGKTYGNLVRNRDINYEVAMRSIIGLPLTIGLAVTNHADFSNPFTYLSLALILVGDKFASAIYSFWPMAREERGLTAGKKSFGFVPQALMEREFTAWIRMALQQTAIALAIASVTSPHGDFRHLGTYMAWLSAIPVYIFDVYMAKKFVEKSPKMDEELKRLQSWVKPKTYLVNALKEVKGVCASLVSLLSETPHRIVPIKNPFSKK